MKNNVDKVRYGRPGMQWWKGSVREERRNKREREYNKGHHRVNVFYRIGMIHSRPVIKLGNML